MKIPYEKQLFNSPSQRSCGAAALRMVYASYGLGDKQVDIWAAISTPSRAGGLYAENYKMITHILSRGLAAVFVQAIDPVELTKRLLNQHIRVIMNYRANASSTAGHYTVALKDTGKGLRLHNPETAPDRFERYNALYKLWTRLTSNDEAIGNVLVAVAQASLALVTCGICSTVIPAEATCKGCGKNFPVQPHVALGCIKPGCISRTWRNVLCPHCNRLQDTI